MTQEIINAEATLETINSEVDHNLDYPEAISIDLSRAASEATATKKVNVVPSKNRLAADVMDRSFEGSMNPWKLPRFYRNNVDGITAVEVIRGYDVCLVHTPNHVDSGCDEKVKSRGLCHRHIGSVRGKVSSGTYTWEVLEASHAVLPGKRRAEKNDIFSLNDYLLTMTTKE